MREVRFIQAINEALLEEMKRDETVFILGECVRGGTFPHTNGLFEKFGIFIVFANFSAFDKSESTTIISLLSPK